VLDRSAEPNITTNCWHIHIKKSSGGFIFIARNFTNVGISYRSWEIFFTSDEKKSLLLWWCKMILPNFLNVPSYIKICVGYFFPPPPPIWNATILTESVTHRREWVYWSEWPVHTTAQTEEQRKWRINLITKITTFITTLNNNNNNKLQKLLLSKCAVFNLGNSSTYAITCNFTIPTTLYTLETWFVSVI
jgi:hypothetical protein